MDFARRYGVILVLKGADTVITDGEQVCINRTGNPGMAMAGCGDLLSGMIGSFLAQGLEPLAAAKPVRISTGCAVILPPENCLPGV